MRAAQSRETPAQSRGLRFLRQHAPRRPACRSSAQGAGVGSPGLSPPLTTGSEMTPQARKAVADVYPRSFPVARSRKEDLVAVVSLPELGLLE